MVLLYSGFFLVLPLRPIPFCGVLVYRVSSNIRTTLTTRLVHNAEGRPILSLSTKVSHIAAAKDNRGAIHPSLQHAAGILPGATYPQGCVTVDFRRSERRTHGIRSPRLWDDSGWSRRRTNMLTRHASGPTRGTPVTQLKGAGPHRATERARFRSRFKQL